MEFVFVGSVKSAVTDDLDALEEWVHPLAEQAVDRVPIGRLEKAPAEVCTRNPLKVLVPERVTGTVFPDVMAPLTCNVCPPFPVPGLP